MGTHAFCTFSFKNIFTSVFLNLHLSLQIWEAAQILLQDIEGILKLAFYGTEAEKHIEEKVKYIWKSYFSTSVFYFSGSAAIYEW